MTQFPVPAPSGACGCSVHSSAPTSVQRRRFLAAGFAAGCALAAGGVARAQSSLAPDAALERLMAGNARFVAKALNSFQEDLAILKQGTFAKQEPFAAVLACADSRIPVELIFDQSIGQLFVARVAGNFATAELIATLEYGAAVLGTRVIMVLGHESCGAVKAAIDGKPVPGQISALYRPLRAAVDQAGPDPEATAKANARIQAALLATASPVLAELIKKGELKVVPAYYALASGRVTLV
ncbi:MAG: carbonic anhydrase [Phenylobacterium sp.]|uniref:carbonic anhydrase n=1 Tax=Phenylobacterium sp. TaxID=1871053 RepID=UPI0025DD7DFD|nr:carbonic anhydrase [Phenylobacterium sp.]MBA4012398.1 carbonic anhydrase [Phenylobacterium sp.]